ncbi:DUF2339 domain-containing protein [Maribacter polysiphoniae]|uniref:DUF2339 domain-containing protein n=1 Tax=Maribacter polysiphoniae TaxID=429344 RepID=A0A316E221_9FLAO|nr:DUF2339 domain-containing protein [Maribacter polysiphoniae]MBD1259111.1 DUF2339 domain-containing protein [Maribacter polysiphoniae]PWK24667.1 putative membrane protein DUF2339 [Maribacter polysiphoniae]
MQDHQNRIDELNQKLETLLSKQEGFAKELMTLYKEIEALKKMGPDFSETKKAITPEPVVEKPIDTPIPKEEVTKEFEAEPITAGQPQEKVKPKLAQKTKTKSNWEKFIGENLINKIGIVITVLGVAIGAKYSIENNLISPLTRIVLGYFAGLGLLGFGIKLKEKYENYSAVLVSGALAILYFITFAAYSFYDLFPQLMTFALMLVFTAFGVVAALHYNKQIIAHIGLVGAYAVPFLLSNDSGSPSVLFSYMAIINIGILIISYKRYWKSLYYSSFVITWLVFASWMGFSYDYEAHFTTALIFLGVFFLIFYATFLVYKLKASEKFKNSDIVLLLLNAFIFYGFGYGLLSQNDTGVQLLGVFTLFNAILHFVVSVIIHKRKLADRNLYYLVSGMVLVFLTIAIPVQLDGNWVTLLWAFEAALLFWIGRKKNVVVYEYLSYPLMVLAVFSLIQDWELSYYIFQGQDSTMRPVFNVTFMSSILFLGAFGFINWVNNTAAHQENRKNTSFPAIMTYAIPSIWLITLFFSLFLEIQYYWDTLYYGSEIAITDEYEYFKYNSDIRSTGNIWLLNYSLLFIAALNLVNIKKPQNRVLGIVSLTAGLFALFVFLTMGLYELSELRESYIDKTLSEYYNTGIFNIVIRYITFAFVALLLVSLYKLIRQAFMKINFNIPFEIILHIIILWVASSELIHWMHMVGSHQSYKLGLSILWGIYALVLVVLGIWQNKKFLRLVAMILFGLTLIKLFFYDIASLNTISKTIVFVSLGVLLLIISFLYNKYKNRISDDETN